MLPSIALAQSLLACSICFGSDGNSLQAANMAVMLLGVVLAGVFAAFIAFIVYLARRSRQVAAEEEQQQSS
ncbi:MAG: hypothetical protein KDN19_09135 [Verrucomicrobiae bacterium]|nr:hypothetical protein [Verrucomicrobiae bacterium]